jgi:hypothetical protein
MSIHKRFGKLRDAYRDDVARIEAEEQRVAKLFKQQEYYQLDTTQELLARCRKDVVNARLKLASEQHLTPVRRAELWQVVDAREWFLKMIANDYAGQLEEIDRELEAELSR